VDLMLAKYSELATTKKALSVETKTAILNFIFKEKL